MYPDWPESDADLVPLPKCDGPKLKAFDFQGKQVIEFLEYIGEGLHAHCFKVKIRGQVYALKLFRFNYDYNWMGPADDTDPNDLATMSAFYEYAEPFNCECRAYGRLQEAGHEELAVKCHGYVLLDEVHERAVMAQFGNTKHVRVHFDGDIYDSGEDRMRPRFLGKNGKWPPVRGILKDFCPGQEEDLRPATCRKILRDMIKLQKLGIFRIDVAARQVLDKKLCDFSSAVTTPHFLTTPELNPRLTPAMIAGMELEVFSFCLDDYLEFNAMVEDWNYDFGDQKGRMSVWAFSDVKSNGQLKYNLRNKAARERLYTFVDPRKYDWRTGLASGATNGTDNTRKQQPGRPSKVDKHQRKRRQLSARPSMWYYKCDETWAARLRSLSIHLEWYYQDGLIFPRLTGGPEGARWLSRAGHPMATKEP